MTDLPKAGDRIPVEHFHVSKCNVRYNEPFGITKEDQEFKEHLKFNSIRVPMEARPEGDEYGIYIGRRRFLAKKDYTTHFVVGRDLLINDVSEEEAREASFIENNEYLKRNMDPITYAEQLNVIASRGGGGIRATAKRLGMPASGLSQYLKLLSLSQKLRNAIRKVDVPFMGKGTQDPYTIYGLAKLELSGEVQDELAEVLESGGVEALWSMIDEKYLSKHKRGIPKDKYYILRTTFDRNNKFDRQLYERLEMLAKNDEMKVDDYAKKVLREYVEALT